MTKKLDKEHLEAIQELQEKFANNARYFGGIAIELKMLEQQKQLLLENQNKWFNMKKYLYQDSIYANYIYFLKTYCVENKSTKCKQLIDLLLLNLGLSKNQHKKNIIRNIRWTL